MRLSLQLAYAGSFKDAAEQVVALERAGLDMVWVPEAWGFDAATQMGYLAAKTEHIQIGSGILPIYSRTPALLAQTAAGLDHLTAGRAVLGLGASGPQVIEGWHGVPYDRPIQRTREIVEICRRIWRREALAYAGRCYTLPLSAGPGTGLARRPLKLLAHPVRRHIPIYLAALGEKNVELAAEIADGWLPLFFIPERAHAVWGSALARGAAKRSPDLPPLEVAAGGLVAIGEGLEHLRDLGRPLLALYVGGMGARGKNFYYELIRRYGWEADARRIQALYLAGKKLEAAAAIPDDLLEATSLVGPPGYVKERLAAYREAGVTVLNLLPAEADPRRTVEQLRRWVDEC